MNIQERLALVYQRLNLEPAAPSADEALAMLCRVLETVENEFCQIPKTDPPPQTFDGRMYVPQPDNIRRLRDGSLWIRTRGHRILIEANGGISAHNLKRRLVEYRKLGV